MALYRKFFEVQNFKKKNFDKMQMRSSVPLTDSFQEPKELSFDR